MTSVTADAAQTTATGRSEEFEALIATHQRRVARLAQRLLGWSGDVDDVVQEVFLAALKGLPKFRGESTVATWLTRLTINACRAHRRKRLLRLEFLRRVSAKSRRAGTAATPEMADDEREDVRRAVRGLPGKYREVVVLRYLEGLEIAEVMVALKLSRSAVEVRLHRAREMLRKTLENL